MKPRLFCLAAAALLFASLPACAQTAQQILAQAQSQASREHKNVLLVFSASWCVPCHMFETFLTDPKTGPIIANSFVVARFDVGERKDDKKHADTPGAEDLRTSLNGTQAGYPFIVAEEPSGKVIVDSFRPVPGKKPGGDTNIGYPALPVEIDWFMEMMRQAAPSMSTGDAKTMRRWLDARGHS